MEPGGAVGDHGGVVSFKICLIGCGYIARASHGPALVRYVASRPDTVLAACCDVEESRAAAFRRDFDVRRGYAEHGRMLDEERPDVVCLAVPPAVTCTIGCDVLRRGIPLLIEKPPGTTAKEVDRLAAAADAGGAPARVAFNRRYSPLVCELATRLRGDGGPAAVRFIRAEMRRVDRRDPDFSLTAIHGIDTVRHLAGCDYREISFRYRDVPGAGPGVANIFLSAMLDTGAVASLEFLPVSGVAMERITVVSDGATWVLAMPIGGVDGGGWLRRYSRGVLEGQTSGPAIAGSADPEVLQGFVGESAEFFDALRGGPRPTSDLLTARQSVVVMQCIRERRTRLTSPRAGSRSRGWR